MQARTLTFMIILSLVIGFVTIARPALGATEATQPELSQQMQDGLSAIAAAEFSFYSRHQCYGRMMEILGEEGSGDGVIYHLLNWHTNGNIRYELALPDTNRPQQFTAFAANSGQADQRIAWRIDQRGTINEADWGKSADWYMTIDPFFAQRSDWALKADAVTRLGLHQVQLGLERWSVDHSPKDGPNLYPGTIETIVADGYIETGYYANPVRSVDPTELTATPVSLGQWSAGDFSYIPYYSNFEDNPQPDGYMLIGYSIHRCGHGDKPNKMSSRGITVILASGNCSWDWFDAVLGSTDE